MHIIAQRELKSLCKKGHKIKVLHRTTGETYQGKVNGLELDNDRLIIDLDGGGQKVIDVLQFILVIIPLIDRIIQSLKRFFHKV